MGPAVRQAFPSGLARAVVVKASAYAAAVAMDGARGLTAGRLPSVPVLHRLGLDPAVPIRTHESSTTCEHGKNMTRALLEGRDVET